VRSFCNSSVLGGGIKGSRSLFAPLLVRLNSALIASPILERALLVTPNGWTSLKMKCQAFPTALCRQNQRQKPLLDGRRFLISFHRSSARASFGGLVVASGDLVKVPCAIRIFSESCPRRHVNWTAGGRNKVLASQERITFRIWN